MSEEPNLPSTNAVLSVLVKSTEVMATITATISSYQNESVVNRQTLREATTNIVAKLDNLDRSISELKLMSEGAEVTRRNELARIFELLGEERKDRKETNADAGKEERALIQEIIRSELGERKQERSLVVLGAQAVWNVGGRYIVLAVSLLFAAIVMKIAGISLADIIGVVGK
ncbi:MAG: hypothetical protein UY48_C0009G0023 [Candidatus Gottesmanbacteria bacterium GW2011_GWB1_49_7]|uniref:Uncharacterized protein n=1 Tax=Candidatus Gottesmanbacteria bacterium GW2011_GWB1_49_7 TaxID=1618448 RepID=A0A0G1W2I9_9BACT|nr:MAG: hypothetical protein UY48_C0009G0023 [Candidatus Gottesmanbacteria bacterium GW2011_GWB1_49_7]